MDVKASAKVRGLFVEAVEGLEVEGFKFLGLTKEGALFEGTEGHVVVKVVVKKEGFDAEDALDEFEEAKEKAAERAAKSKEKVEKAKAKKEADKE